VSDLEEAIVWHVVKPGVVLLVIVRVALDSKGLWKLEAVIRELETNPRNLFL
jgi:hypothetical protein